MIKDMTIRKLAPRTQHGYIRSVKDFGTFFGASPAKARFEDLRRYQLHLASSGASAANINSRLTAPTAVPGNAEWRYSQSEIRLLRHRNIGAPAWEKSIGVSRAPAIAPTWQSSPSLPSNQDRQK